MISIPAWKILVVGSIAVFAAAMAGCSSTSTELAEFRMAKLLAEQQEQERLDRQRLAGLEGGLARSLQLPRRAESDADTLANLLSGGEEVFSALSAAVWRDYQNRTSAQPGMRLGAF